MKKGVLTIEAAIILPMIILIVFSLANLHLYFLVYEKIDYEITKVAVTVAEKSYAIRAFGFKFSDDTFIDVGVNKYNQIKNNGKNLISSLSTDQLVQIDGSSLGSFISTAIQSAESYYNYIKAIVDSLADFLNSISSIKSKGFLKEIIASLKNPNILSPFISSALKYQTENSLKQSGNKEMELSDYYISNEGLDFSESKFWAEDGNQNNIIKIVVKYKMEFPIYGLGKQKITKEVKQTRIVRAWVGK